MAPIAAAGTNRLPVEFLFALLLVAFSTQSGSCAGPAFSPVKGYPGTVVEVQGIDLAGVRIVWNAGAADEAVLPGNLESAPFFSVPPKAGTAVHRVRLERKGSPIGEPLDFTVIAGSHPRPRLDDVTVTSFGIDASGYASFNVMAHGANIDVGSEILINGDPQPTHFFVVYQNASHLTAHDPSTLGYPIFHYATVYAPLRMQIPGDLIDVAIRNLDGKISNTLAYRVAHSMSILDSDGDGLSDDWETRGADTDDPPDGIIDVDLPRLGAHPLRKDIFVEVDWMPGYQPKTTIWATIEDTFDTAPVLNSDGSQGISAHIDRGQSGAGGGGGSVVPLAQFLGYDAQNPGPGGADYLNFHAIKANPTFFDPKRLPIYRYCIFANDNAYQQGSSGQAEGIWANDFFVSLGGWGALGRLDSVQIGTFMHELGHTLNLRHGGFEDTNKKDNYNSIMQYGKRRIVGDPIPTSPAQVSGIDVDCNLLNKDFVFTYSQGMRAALNERALDERIGMCDHAQMDWNGNGAIEPNVSFNLDADPELTIILDYADWANIELDFRAAGSHWNYD